MGTPKETFLDMINKPLEGANKYLNDHYGKKNISVPAYERMMQLNAMGHKPDQINFILNQELADIDFNTYTTHDITVIIKDNKEEFERFRKDMGLKCREKVQDQIARLFEVVKDEEHEMVEVFAGKMKEALLSLRNLDLNELDDDGNYKNTSRIFVLTEMVIKLQSSVSKIVGTDALREVEIFRAKARAKQESENEKTNGLLPSQSRDVEIEVGNETNWH